MTNDELNSLIQIQKNLEVFRKNLERLHEVKKEWNCIVISSEDWADYKIESMASSTLIDQEIKFLESELEAAERRFANVQIIHHL